MTSGVLSVLLSTSSHIQTFAKGPFLDINARIDHDVKSESTKVEPLRLEHAKKVSQTILDAFEDDPLQVYLRETPDAKKPKPFPGGKTVIQAYFSLVVAQWIRRKLAYTINGGDAVSVGTPAPVTQSKPAPIDRLLDVLLSLVNVTFQSMRSPEQKKRAAELKTKSEACLQRTFGPKLAEMVYLDALATAPAWQGHGYGGLVLETIISLADEQGRAIYLLSSNVSNTYFYNLHGFVTVANIQLGVDNPTWRAAPVVIPVMIHEPMSMSERKLLSTS